LLVSCDALQAAHGTLTTLLQRLARKPEATSIKASELRSQASIAPEVFDLVIADLVRHGTVQLRGDELSLESSQGSPSRESSQLAVIAQAYEAAGLAAPLVPELAQRLRLRDMEIRRLITLLQRQKIIVRVGSDDLFMHTHALDALVSRVRSLRGSLIDVAGFKQLTGLSRKYAIPLLEYLDRARVTRKQGDQRLVL
jgi:selenocysteine-specific elongation factor